MKSVLFEICRWTAVAAAIFFIIKTTGGKSPVSHADPQTVFETTYACADTDNMQPASNQMIKRLYGIDPSEYAFCTLYYPLTNMDVDELLLIKYADSSQEQQVQSAIEARLDEQKKVFQDYGVGQMELLNDHSVFILESGFALFTVNLNADRTAEAFDKALKGE